MNLMKKIYCRIFQTAFRIALPVLPYRDPGILKNVQEIPPIIKNNHCSNALIVTDKTIASLGLTKPLEQALTAAGLSYAIYDKTLPNPTTAMVDEALSLYHSHKCDCLIAFGGGSPMDCTKAVGARIARPKKPLGKMAGILRVWHKLPLLIAVPTTAGTGSETTLAAVIVDDRTHHKYVINDFNLIPQYALLDRTVIHSLPKSVAATTGIDAMTHAIEAYIGRSTTRQTRADALEAVRLIFENIEAASLHTSDEAEANMLWAAHLAGRAFTRSYVGYIHAVSHSLSGKYNLAHGKTNAILLPVVLEMYGRAAHKKLAQIARYAKIGRADDSDEMLAKELIRAITRLNERLDIPKTIPEIKEADIPEMAAYADKEGNPLYPVLLLWDAKELENIYRSVI